MADGTSFYIPDDAISEDIESMTCRITTGNLYDASLPNVLLLQKELGDQALPSIEAINLTSPLSI